MLVPMKFYIVRHAEAAGGPVDAERPLTDKGRQDAQRMAAFLRRAGCRPDRIIHSGRVRARDTALLLAQVVGNGVVEEASQGLGPDDVPRGVAEAAGGWQDDVMVVSHQPFVGRLVSLLTVGDESAEVVGMATGAVACLKRHKSGRWSVRWLATPALLGQ